MISEGLRLKLYLSIAALLPSGIKAKFLITCRPGAFTVQTKPFDEGLSMVSPSQVLEYTAAPHSVHV